LELIDAVERSLFSVGAVTSRIDAESEEFLLHPQMLDVMTEHEARSGLLVLLVRVLEDGPLTARVGESTIRVESEELVDVEAGATAPGVVAAAVRRLLEAEGIFIASEGANL
jgi:hypothetical protein